ncbi:3'(2'),5'-bisphosphate nucleotidase CysQ [Thiotrichales bacterium 19S3-7]|nr:3'(2'),5'-bisphosphate nucleotidase CysQ [Thiotrichales bacterium 19S3-7]MCF6802299.1 3'(2'),5'-bisphosphate nucleotidase CysQ [Thiotrichales bacterium 19S3-11]
MKKLVDAVIEIAIEAADILKFYHKTNIKIKQKSDQSPLTIADTKAHQCIAEKLMQLTPDIPILSEESEPMPDYEQRKSWQTYWLIDPLDGTKSFVNAKDDFVISIALIKNHQPIVGVIYVPVGDICYYALANHGAFKRTVLDLGKNDIKLCCNSEHDDDLKITIGSSKPLSERLINNLERIKPYRILRTSSALKFCQVAEGVADIYLRLYPTYEWDTAAGQCILSEAGGKCVDLENETILFYNRKESLINPYFIAGVPWAIERLIKHL